MTDQPQEAARSAGGGERDTRNLKARRRDMYRTEVLESLKQRGLIQQVAETADKLADETVDLDPQMVARLKAANDARLALIRKYLPDLKAMEHTGADGGPIEQDVSIGIRFL